MNYRIVEAKHISDYSVWLRFSDGLEGEVDLTEELWGPVFEPLKKAEQFKKLAVHPELHTLVWPNGADFSPEFLHDIIKITA